MISLEEALQNIIECLSSGKPTVDSDWSVIGELLIGSNDAETITKETLI